MDFILGLTNMQFLNYLLKQLYISYGTYYIALILTNNKKILKKNIIKVFALITIAAAISSIIKYLVDFTISIFLLIVMLAYVLSLTLKRNIGYSILVSTICLSINYVIFLAATLVSFIPVVLFKIYDINFSFIIIIVIHIFIMKIFLNIKRFKKGLAFLQNQKGNEYFDILILNISVIILFSDIILSNYNMIISRSVVIALILFAIIMFITIQKSLQIYYKQKLLIQELEETKNELEKKNKEIKELEQENLNFSKTSHTLAHKQKALEYKLNQLINQSAKNEPTKNNTNASREDNITHQANKPENIETEQIQDIKERLAEISKDLYQNEKPTRLAQTGIKRIDDMLEYMQSESEKQNIKLELQITGNIHHMTNKIIEEKDLETLIADHVKNAIIAINHSKNENKSILVKLGKIEENYGLAIYDTGIEFEKETLKNLGKKPSTTHAEEGGTGMGFMNTFDTINKYKASLIINEIGKESETNYTKAIIIKFDQKNEFKIDSYRQQKSTRTAKK